MDLINHPDGRYYMLIQELIFCGDARVLRNLIEAGNDVQYIYHMVVYSLEQWKGGRTGKESLPL
jgi:hypothetical protein